MGLAVGAGIGAGGAATTTSAAAAPATVTVTAPAPAPRTVTVTAPAAAPQTVTVTAAPTTEAAPATASSVSDGVYKAGVDIRAGRYKTSGGGTYGTCIWQTSRDGSSGFEAFVDGGSSSGQMYASVESGQFLELTGGCTWTKVG
ncbi:hypothetical protein [Pseudonocardia sp. T1-2H]|uniref:hypothetical protein n=1 Tax=Pseudonocardia sp. T1-2H TaxID=3128899 RepID=UPI003101734F